MIKGYAVIIMSLIVLGGCGDKDQDRGQKGASDMKCGAGKCGANMFDGNTALANKKKNILSQMRQDDPRRECVLKAETTKAVYNCVRDPRTGKLSTKCGTDTKEPVMKCGEGKCGSSE